MQLLLCSVRLFTGVANCQGNAQTRTHGTYCTVCDSERGECMFYAGVHFCRNSSVSTSGSAMGAYCCLPPGFFSGRGVVVFAASHLAARRCVFPVCGVLRCDTDSVCSASGDGVGVVSVVRGSQTVHLRLLDGVGGSSLLSGVHCDVEVGSVSAVSVMFGGVFGGRGRLLMSFSMVSTV